MTGTIPPEPADRTALYWPETADEIGTLLVLRDDKAAAAFVDEPTVHWHSPNTTDPWLTWPQVLEILDELDLDLADALPLTADRIDAPGGGA
jgi:hypothetical protein